MKTKKPAKKPLVTRTEIETFRSVCVQDCRKEPDALTRAFLYTQIEACDQKLERDFGVSRDAQY